MSAPIARRLAAGATVLAAGAAALAIPTMATPESRSSSSERVTRSGVGEVKLGRTFRALREDGLVGRLRPGCELGGPNTRSANLRSPLRGSVDFTQRSPRRATNITIRGGATARGVAVGDRAREIRRAYPRARFDRSTEEVFGITLVTVPRRGGGRLQFAVDAETRRVELIGVPVIAFCE